MPTTGDLACNPVMYPDWESNQRPFSLQAGAQSTESHELGDMYFSMPVTVHMNYNSSTSLSALEITVKYFLFTVV